MIGRQCSKAVKTDEAKGADMANEVDEAYIGDRSDETDEVKNLDD